MQKLLYPILSLLLACSLLAGCEASAASAESEGGFPGGEMNGGPGEWGGERGGEPPEGGTEAPSGGDAGAEPETLAENQSQITGKVLSIVGTEVVLALGSYGSSGGEGGSAGRASSVPEEDAEGAPPEGGLSSGDPPGGNEVPDAGPMAETGPSGDAAMTDEKQPAAKPGTDASAGSAAPVSSGGKSGGRGFTESGVTQTLLVPVGLTLSGAGGGQRSRDYSSISAGMILRITMETLDDGSEAVVAVRVLSNE